MSLTCLPELRRGWGKGQYQTRHVLSLLPAGEHKHKHVKCAIKHFLGLERSCSKLHFNTVFVYTCNDRVALIVEHTGEDLVGVSLQNLKADTWLNIPQTSCLVWASSQDPAALGAETDLPRETGVLVLFRGGWACTSWVIKWAGGRLREKRLCQKWLKWQRQGKMSEFRAVAPPQQHYSTAVIQL